MKYLSSIFHFLGSIYFAIVLIVAVAAFTIAGTLIESKTASHQYAAHFTYESPFFALLLWGFFINILFSAMRRWPFKKRHVPFLITHAGLLMILGGVIIKNFFGLQGTMVLMEGSASDEVFEKGTYALQLEKRGEHVSPLSYELKKDFRGHFHLKDQPRDGLQVEVVGYSPHSTENLQTWIKGDHGYILGLKPFPIYTWSHQKQPLPISLSTESWDIYAFRTSDVSELAKVAYLQGMNLALTHRHSEKCVYQNFLTEALRHPLPLSEGDVTTTLDWDFSREQGSCNPNLTLVLNPHNQIHIPLSGSQSLLGSSSYLGNSSLAVDLERRPTLLFIEDEHQDVYLFAFDAHGRVYSQIFKPDALNPIVVYDKGYGGYAAQAAIPFGKNFSRHDVETIQKNQLIDHLKQGISTHSQLTPPLEGLKKACLDCHQDFEKNFVDFLAWWDHSPRWLFPSQISLPAPLDQVFASLTLSPQEQKACHWISRIFQEIEPQLTEGKDIPLILHDIKWPIELQKDLEPLALLTLLTQQIFAVADLLPPIEQEWEMLSPSHRAHFLSAYLRAYGIHWSSIAAPPAIDVDTLYLEAPITSLTNSSPPTNKLEENLPLITLKITKGKVLQWLKLTYDPHVSNFRWPILNGEYLIRFQPKFKKIPHKLRLRQARQINYANSIQPYSYESDLIITDTKTKTSLEKTISMNHVHETWDGYRFYLANLHPADESAVKHAQIVINHDPAKYWLTYPGAILLTLGIISLFWMKPYSF